jgi:hypothetical protein
MRRSLFALPLAIALSACASSSKPATIRAPVTTAVAPTTTRPAGPTPFQVLKAEVDALNRGDVAGSIAYFAPNAELITPLGGCNPCVGTALIREHWSGAAANQTKLTADHPRTVGDIVTVRSSISSPQFPTGITRAIGTATVEVRNGKITRLDVQYDRSDPQTAALLAIVAGTRSRASAARP